VEVKNGCKEDNKDNKGETKEEIRVRMLRMRMRVKPVFFIPLSRVASEYSDVTSSLIFLYLLCLPLWISY